MDENYSHLLRTSGLTGPLAFVDLTLFDDNARRMASLVRGTDLKIRIATKSLRVPELIRRALNSSAAYQGLMCFCAAEAAFLAEQGFDDLLIAYPTASSADLALLKKLHDSGKTVSLVVDSREHLQTLATVFNGSSRPFSVLFEVDLSLRLGPLVVGVRRSPLRQPQDVLNLLGEIRKLPSLRFSGIMAYEAHVAGVGDRNPFKPLLSQLLKPLRRFSARQIAAKRRKISELLRLAGEKDFIFNGGGTGSLSFNIAEKNVLTELTAGSGFYCPHLFDYYTNLNLKPAAFYALQIARKPEPGWYTCLGGGFVASGEPGWDRIARPPDGFKLSGFEATGEVQTPVQTTADLRIGDSVIFRHAKAGELMERFNEVTLIENGKITGHTKTYRGHGECYF